MTKSLLGKPRELLLRSALSARRLASLAAMIVLLLTAQAAQAQALSGAYTINSAQTTGGTNFASFTDLAGRLNLFGISGPVTITVSGGPYTEQFLLGSVGGASATSPLVINGGGSTIKFASANTSQRAVVQLNGTSYTTISNLVIDATGGTYGFGIAVSGTGTNVRIANNTINADITTTSSGYAGIVVSGSLTAATTIGDSPSNVTVEGNTVNGGYYGITMVGTSSTALNTGNIVRNNVVRDFYFYGIYGSYQDGAQFIGNDISRPLRTNGSTFYGLYISTTSRGLAIEKNRIHDAFTSSPTSTNSVYALYVTTSTTATATGTNDILNNVIYNMTGNGTQYLLYVSGTAYCRIYNNSINSDDQTATTTSGVYGIYQPGANSEVRNNVVSITRAGTGTKYGLYYITSAAPTSNNNDVYVPSSNVGYYGAAFNTLANWQTANSGAFDQSSLSIDPVFVNPSVGNLLPGNVALNNTGAPLARVTDDITGATRGAVPDPGAYEFTPVATDISPLALAGPTVTSSCYGTAEAVIVQVRNSGTAALNFATNPATVTVVVTPPTGAAQTLTATVSTGTLAAGATQSVTLTGTLNMSALGTYSFAVTATVTGDANTGNDVLTPAATRTTLAPVAGTLSPSSTTICVSGTAALSLAGSANGNVQYQSGPSATGPFTDVAGATSATYTTPVLSTTAYYRARITCNTNTVYSNVAALTVTNPQVATTNTPQTICAGTTATLTATASAGSTVRFFDTATGGTALTTSTPGSYTTPALTASTTYYAEALTGATENVGAPAFNSTGQTPQTGGALYFTATAPTTINTVTVYLNAGQAAGTVTISLRTGSSTGGAVVNSQNTAFPVPAGPATGIAPYVLPLNFVVPAAGQYTLYLGTASQGGLLRDALNGANSVFPFPSPSGVITITGTSVVSYYYYFYNWQIGSECVNATRTPVQVNVTPAPTATLTSSNPAGGGVLLTATPVTGATYQFFRNGVAVAAASTTNTLLLQSGTLNGSYTVVVTSGGCSSAPSTAINVTVTSTHTASLNGVSLLVYPNPTPDGNLTLELTGPQAKASQLTVSNSLGQVVHMRTLTAGTATLNFGHLAAGVYTLQVQTPEGILTQRIVRE